MLRTQSLAKMRSHFLTNDKACNMNKTTPYEFLFTLEKHVQIQNILL